MEAAEARARRGRGQRLDAQRLAQAQRARHVQRVADDDHRMQLALVHQPLGLDRKIADLKERLGRITIRWSAGNIPDAAYDAAVAQLDRDLAALTARRRTAAPSPRADVDPQKMILALDEDWEDFTVIEQRNLLRAVIHQVRIQKPKRQGTGVWRERVEIIPTWAPTVD